MWKDLVVDCLKINIHAAINSKEKVVRLGIIIRNHEGDQVMAVGCQKLQVVARRCEALSLKEMQEPVTHMTPAAVIFLGGLIGRVRDIDLGATKDCLGRYLRVRVVIDASKPLKTLTSTPSSLPPSSQSGEPQVVDNVE
ncbi:hypothetical protein ACOSQ4_023546 [Xanthoceras sorbifolium]